MNFYTLISNEHVAYKNWKLFLKCLILDLMIVQHCGYHADECHTGVTVLLKGVYSSSL